MLSVIPKWLMNRAAFHFVTFAREFVREYARADISIPRGIPLKKGYPPPSLSPTFCSLFIYHYLPALEFSSSRLFFRVLAIGGVRQEGTHSHRVVLSRQV